jgi:hypothetical protein
LNGYLAQLPAYGTVEAYIYLKKYHLPKPKLESACKTKKERNNIRNAE